ncbi:pyridoxamine 5'-phosphate oxidase family protein [Deminuibacter soli]|uniref:General stress protein FMN-binding split barrel domain-containing protein n=1 Tax=Deminuibacter soli TaxID=2291815 RepID=A0A3E1NL30_9BACT|nr:pyridoxamine 5'-phosphate oxidase family protein [Deminuibacter soli]RFM28617.1 hypothetical protein DXN05_07420 [Deminuibacter soli]
MITPDRPENKNLFFLQDKIKEIRTAICYNDSTALTKLPTSVVYVITVNEGDLWFLLPQPTHVLDELETQFPVQLDFHKKGGSCNLQVSGTASVVADKKIIRSLKRRAPKGSYQARHPYIAVKVKMQQAQYCDRTTNEKKSLLKILSSLFHNMWNVEPAYRYFELTAPSN